jgi:hypothetical protein
VTEQLMLVDYKCTDIVNLAELHENMDFKLVYNTFRKYRGLCVYYNFKNRFDKISVCIKV